MRSGHWLAPRHVALLEVVDKLHRLLTLGLTNRFENTRLGNPAEIVVDGRLSTRGNHLESDGARKDVGVIEPSADSVGGDAALIVAVGGLVERIDRG